MCMGGAICRASDRGRQRAVRAGCGSVVNSGCNGLLRAIVDGYSIIAGW